MVETLTEWCRELRVWEVAVVLYVGGQQGVPTVLVISVFNNFLDTLDDQCYGLKARLANIRCKSSSSSVHQQLNLNSR